MIEFFQTLWDIVNEFELVIIVLIGLIAAIGVRIWKKIKR